MSPMGQDLLTGQRPGLYALVLPGHERAQIVELGEDGSRTGADLSLTRFGHGVADDQAPLVLGPILGFGDGAGPAAAVDPFAVIEERIQSALSTEARTLVSTGIGPGGEHAGGVNALAEALQRIRALQAQAPKPVTLADRDKVMGAASAAWSGANEAGAPVAACDAARDAVLEAFGFDTVGVPK